MTYKDNSGKTYTKKIGARKSIAQLKNLKKFSSYTVMVTAKTDEGLGDTSSAVAVTTMEDGKFCTNCIVLSFLSCMNVIYKDQNRFRKVLDDYFS